MMRYTLTPGAPLHLQHLSELSYDDARGALSSAGLKAGAICLRFPKEMQAGAFTHPDKAMRAKVRTLLVSVFQLDAK